VSQYSDAAQKAQNYNNNRGGNSRYVPFSQQGRQVQPSGSPDPFNPWDGWKPGDPKDWKTWVGTGVGIIGAATDIYQQAQDLPSNNRLPSGKWTPLPPINLGGTARNWSPQQSSGVQSRNSGSFNAQVSAIQAQINQIQAQINAIVQSRSGVSR
jgi:hypothetical protein